MPLHLSQQIGRSNKFLIIISYLKYHLFCGQAYPSNIDAIPAHIISQ